MSFHVCGSEASRVIAVEKFMIVTVPWLLGKGKNDTVC